eukprot:1098183-Rhodomonas_salina.3
MMRISVPPSGAYIVSAPETTGSEQLKAALPSPDHARDDPCPTQVRDTGRTDGTAHDPVALISVKPW